MHVTSIVYLLPYYYIRCSAVRDSEEDEAGCDGASDSESYSPLTNNVIRKKLQRRTVKKRKAGKNTSAVVKPSVKKGTMTARKKGKQEVNTGGKTTFSVESVLDSFKEPTEYGTAFRSMDVEAQKLEVVRLNKGAATGMKGAIRKQRIDVQFKSLVSEKLKAHLIANRTEQKNMFRTVTHPRTLQKLQLKFLSVGEWVEVDADRTPGWNSEGGIAVIVAVNDGLADVK
jgi:hypothetical protein